MKVLAVTSSFPRFRGDYYGSFIHELCERLALSGVEVTVLAPRSRSTTSEDTAFTVKRFPFMPSQGIETLPEQTMKNASFSETIQLPMYLGAAYLSLIKESTQIVHAHFTFPMGLLAALSPRKVPLLITCHGSDCTLPYTQPEYRLLARTALKKADRVVVVSEFIKGLAIDLGARREKTEVIYTGIDVEKFRSPGDRRRLQEEFGIPEGRWVVGTLGRLVPEKRVEDFIRAAFMIGNKEDFQFVVGGEGPSRPHLERLSKALKVDNITFLGEVSDAVRFHQLCDVFVLTSIREGLSVSLQEAMSTGNVPVAANGCGNPEIITDGENGYLFEPMDVHGLTEKIVLAVDSPELGRRARSTMTERFDSRRNVGRYIELYEELTFPKR